MFLPPENPPPVHLGAAHERRARPLLLRQTTQMYLHADLALKERALARTKPLDSKPGRYRPPDALLGFLDGL